MNNISISLTILFWCICCTCLAQVYPGDSNDDGFVEKRDFLYSAYAYGETGPRRFNNDIDFAAQTIPAFWESDFPDDLNYAFADADGNGLIDFRDFLVILNNYGEERVHAEDLLESSGIITTILDPQLAIEESGGGSNMVTSGMNLEFPITLGSEDAMLNGLNGVSFTIKVDGNGIQEADWQFDDQSWLNFDNELFYIEQRPNFYEFDVALTRFGIDPVNGFGRIGTFSIVIEDDLIDLLPTPKDTMEISVKIEDIFAINDSFAQIPIQPYELILKAYREDRTVSTKFESFQEKIHVFPNPSTSQISISSLEPIEGIRLLGRAGTPGRRGASAGMASPTYSKGQHLIELDLSPYPPGWYYLEILLQTGEKIRKPIVKI